MANNQYTKVSREIWPALAVIAAVAVILKIVFLSLLPSLPLWILFGLLAFAFRDPTRDIPSSPLAVVSPVDGRVVSIEPVSNPYIDAQSIRITLKARFYNVYRIRSPIEGRTMQRWFLLPGDPLPVQQGPVGSMHLSNWIQTDESDDVVVVVRKGSQKLRPRCNIQAGDRIGQGQRCGMIPFGADVDIYVPANSKLEIAVGDKVLAGSDVVAILKHSSDTVNHSVGKGAGND